MIGFDEADRALLRCPKCANDLKFDGALLAGVVALNGKLQCHSGHIWRVKRSLPTLFDAQALTGNEQRVDFVYDLIAPFHDHAVEHLLPLLEYPSGPIERTKYIEELRLDELRRRAGARLLEIGVGSGANWPLIFDGTADADRLVYWGVDINQKMLATAVHRAQDVDRRMRLAYADAHALPFADSSFDAVLNVGSLNAYRDPKRGIQEMLRVAKPGAPIVVVDEELDTGRRNSIAHKLIFCTLTFFDRIKKAPLELLPAEAKLLNHFAVSRFFYCLTFCKRPKANRGSTRRGNARGN